MGTRTENLTVFCSNPMALSANFNSSIGMDRNRIIIFHSLHKLVAEQIDRDDALPVPDVLHEDAGGSHGIDVLGQQQGQRSNTHFLHAHKGGPTQGRADRARGAEDAVGKIQLYFKRDDICPGEDKSMYNIVFKRLLDIGDIIGVKGYVFTTKMGEITIHVTAYTLLSKSLKPLPVVKEKDGEVWDAFTDPEQRYRQRYLDLIVNPEIRNTFIQRAELIRSMRDFLNEKGYLEVETPILQPLYGGAAARPFKTHHNSLDMTLYLRIANELYLKRLIVGGYDGVYEFSKDFRNEGMDRFHNPEFTMLEFYEAYADYKDLMDLTEDMLRTIAQDVLGDTVVQYQEDTYDFGQPFVRMTMIEAILKHAPQITEESLQDLESAKQVAESLKIDVKPIWGLGKIHTEIFEEVAEHKLMQPTFITEYPAEVSPLARRNDDNPFVTDRFEFFVGGREIANGFSELNDAEDQAERFEQQVAEKDAGDDEAMYYDQDYIRALEYGLPPTAGEGIGIDRLVMLFTNAPSIRDVLLFPHMRPEADSK